MLIYLYYDIHIVKSLFNRPQQLDVRVKNKNVLTFLMNETR